MLTHSSVWIGLTSMVCCGLTYATTNLQQILDTEKPYTPNRPPDETSWPEPKRVAIVGSGIAGATIAYRLSQVYGHRVPFEVTVFEQSSQIGGYINSTLFDNDNHTNYAAFLETGASVFWQDDFCMQTAVDNVGLRQSVTEMPGRRNFRQNSDVDVGVWEFGRVHTRRVKYLKPRSKSEIWEDLWRYGMSLFKLGKIIQNKLSSFNELYGEHSYYWDLKLIEAIKKAGLVNESQTEAYEYFKNAGISKGYLHDVVEPTVRLLYGRNLDDINALAALVAMDTAPTFRIKSDPHGTLELVDRLFRLSHADIKLGTKITSMRKISSEKFELRSSNGTNETSTKEKVHKGFDDVIITSDLRDIDFDINLTNHTSSAPAESNRSVTHVTYFSTPLTTHFSKELFNVSTSEQIPNIIYTTSTQELGILSLEHTEQWLGFQGRDYDDSERVFKITSTQEISDELIVKLLGYQVGAELDDIQVRWVHRKAWAEYLVETVRGPKLDNMQLAPGLYYTGVAQELLPTMEMSCRVGVQVADFVYRHAYGRWT